MTKKELLLDVLSRSWAFLYVDGGADGVDLPDWLRLPWVKLDVGYNMPVPIPDLAVDDEGITATLSFRRTPHTCRLPWASVFAISDDEKRGKVWESDVPQLVRHLVSTELRLGEPPAITAAAVGSTDADSGPRTRSGRPRPSHLKLV